MQKALLVTASLTFLFIIGCGGGGGGDSVNPPPPGDNKAEWTFMLYWGGDNNLASDAILDIEELEQVGSTDKVHFTFLADVYFEQMKSNGDFDIISINDSNGNPVVPMMHISKHPEEGIQSHLTDNKAILKPADGFNSADPQNLTDFIKWSVQRFPAKHYALTLLNHGGSWLPGRQVTGIIYDNYDAQGGGMFISEVETAVKNSSIHLDILDFDACNMAGIEILYELKDVTDYFCSSQRTEFSPANDYKTIASHLTGNPNMNAEQLGRIILDSFADRFMQQGENSVTKSLIRTDKLENLVSSISTLSSMLTNSSITNSVELRDRFTEPIMFFQDVDLYNLLDVLANYYPGISDTINNVKSAISEVVVYNRYFTGSGESIDWSFGSREFSQGQDVNVNGVAGINIFLPTSRDFTEDNVSYYSGLTFNFASHWYDVIHYAYWGSPFCPLDPAGWWSGLVWDSNADLDFWIFEPDGYGGISPACPAYSSRSINGFLSSDSYWTGIPFESYIAYPNVLPGPYFFLAVFGGIGIFGSDANCMLALGDDLSDMDPMLSDIFYISPYSPDDPDFGPGVVYFGFAFYNPADGYWYMAWDDRSGDSVRQNQFSVINSELATRHASSNKKKVQQQIGLDEETINLYHKQGLELARKLKERK